MSKTIGRWWRYGEWRLEEIFSLREFASLNLLSKFLGLISFICVIKETWWDIGQPNNIIFFLWNFSLIGANLLKPVWGKSFYLNWFSKHIAPYLETRTVLAHWKDVIWNNFLIWNKVSLGLYIDCKMSIILVLRVVK